jgi:hypothetical protein
MYQECVKHCAECVFRSARVRALSARVALVGPRAGQGNTRFERQPVVKHWEGRGFIVCD